MKTIKILWQAFSGAFREGFGLYFSPFVGFWQALGRLRIPSMVQSVFKPGEKGTAHH